MNYTLYVNIACLVINIGGKLFSDWKIKIIGWRFKIYKRVEI